MAEGLQLHHLKSASAVKDIVLQPSYYRSHWLVGFGWNQNSWPTSEFPDSKILDEAFGNTPVFFSRVDGHASWLNSAALNELRILGFDFSKDPEGGKIARLPNGDPSGLLFDSAHIQALAKLPEFSPVQHRIFFETSQKIFNHAGFTHVRDLSMSLAAWTLLRTMEEQKALTVALDAFVTAENLQDLNRVFGEIKIIKADPSAQMRLLGVKIFIDGSLGSKTAHLSQPYRGELHTGLLIWSYEDIKTAVRRCWQSGFHLAVHTIGDQAAHLAVKAAREVSAEGIAGRLHLEHVQCLRPETIQMMKPIHVTCYMQPCHWLSDHAWLEKTLPPELIPTLFQWEQLRKNKIPFFFGSDSPIEAVSLFNTKLALEKSAAQGIPKLDAPWTAFHAHPDQSWCPSFTEIRDGRVLQVYFQNQPLL